MDTTTIPDDAPIPDSALFQVNLLDKNCSINARYWYYVIPVKQTFDG